MDRRSFMAGCAGLSLSAIAQDALGESGPLTKMIFPFSAGGGGDALCRLVAQHVGQLLDRTIIVENRTGGDGLIGIKCGQERQPRRDHHPGDHRSDDVSAADGGGEPSFDLTKDFVPVSLLARFEFGVVTGPAVDAKDFKQFVAWLKANPSKATFGVPSNGTIPHFTGSKLEQVLGIPMTRVAYRGSAPVINDLIGGHLPFGIVTIADAIPQHRAGGVKILAVSSAERSPFLPDVPTLKESGIDLVADAWYGMWLPAGSSPGFCQATQCGRGRIARQAGSAREAAGDRPDSGRAQRRKDCTRELAANTALWQPIVKATGYKITY